MTSRPWTTAPALILPLALAALLAGCAGGDGGGLPADFDCETDSTPMDLAVYSRDQTRSVTWTVHLSRDGAEFATKTGTIGAWDGSNPGHPQQTADLPRHEPGEDYRIDASTADGLSRSSAYGVSCDHDRTLVVEIYADRISLSQAYF